MEASSYLGSLKCLSPLVFPSCVVFGTLQELFFARAPSPGSAEQTEEGPTCVHLQVLRQEEELASLAFS